MADSVVEYVRALEEEVKLGARMAERFNERLKEQHEQIRKLEKFKQAPQAFTDAELLKEIERIKWRLRDLGDELARRVDAHAEELKELR